MHRRASYVHWREGDVLKLMDVPAKLRHAYPASDLRRPESVQAGEPGQSDYQLYSGLTQGGKDIQFYGWQVVDKDARFASELDRIAAELDVIARNLSGLTQPLRTRRDYGAVDEEEETKVASIFLEVDTTKPPRETWSPRSLDVAVKRLENTIEPAQEALNYSTSLYYTLTEMAQQAYALNLKSVWNEIDDVASDYLRFAGQQNKMMNRPWNQKIDRWAGEIRQALEDKDAT